MIFGCVLAIEKITQASKYLSRGWQGNGRSQGGIGQGNWGMGGYKTTRLAVYSNQKCSFSFIHVSIKRCNIQKLHIIIKNLITVTAVIIKSVGLCLVLMEHSDNSEGSKTGFDQS